MEKHLDVLDQYIGMFAGYLIGDSQDTNETLQKGLILIEAELQKIKRNEDFNAKDLKTSLFVFKGFFLSSCCCDKVASEMIYAVDSFCAIIEKI